MHLLSEGLRVKKKLHTKVNVGTNLQLTSLEKYIANKWMVFFHTRVDGEGIS